MNAIPDAARIVRTVRGMAASDGAGVKLTRVIGTAQLPDLDPFLMLDEFGTDRAEDYLAGFPDHPHRGFETVTYMLDGRMRHKDNHGNEGLLVPGSVQWMTAGRGIRLQVDGGITPQTAPAMIEAGADVLVAGSAVFAQADYAAAIQALRPSYSV